MQFSEKFADEKAPPSRSGEGPPGEHPGLNAPHTIQSQSHHAKDRWFSVASDLGREVRVRRDDFFLDENRPLRTPRGRKVGRGIPGSPKGLVSLRFRKLNARACRPECKDPKLKALVR